MARGQIAFEFSFMLLFAFLFFTVALIIIAVYVEKYGGERAYVLLQDEAGGLQQELLLAAGVEDGYQRLLVVPVDLDGHPYALANTETLLTLTLNDGTNYNKEIPPVTGTIVKGSNRLRKIGGSLLIDQP